MFFGYTTQLPSQGKPGVPGKTYHSALKINPLLGFFLQKLGNLFRQHLVALPPTNDDFSGNGKSERRRSQMKWKETEMGKSVI